MNTVLSGYPDLIQNSYNLKAWPHSTVGSVSDQEPEVPGSICGPATYFCFPLQIQEGQLSVTGKSMCTKLLNHLGGLSLPKKNCG